MTDANRPTPANPDNGDDLLARLEAAMIYGGRPRERLAAVIDLLADQLEDRANALRDGPFRTGEVGIEYINGYEAAAYHLRTRAEDSKVRPRAPAEESNAQTLDDRRIVILLPDDGVEVKP